MAQTAPEPRVVEIDEITLDGRTVRVRNEALQLDSVRLDPRNPRIANTIALEIKSREASQAELSDKLWADPDVRELYQQVKSNGGLIERIIVRHDGTVVEGNCRTVVYRKLRQKEPRNTAWSLIPARILPESITERSIAILLGEMHVAGKNTWTAFEKAGHIYAMHHSFGLTQDEIAQRLRMSKSKVNQLIQAFELMKKKYLVRYPQHASIRKFSYFEELLKKSELRSWLKAEHGAEDRFVDWVGSGKIPRGVDVRELPAIVENAEALRALSNHGFDAAQKIVAADNPALTSKLFRTLVDATSSLHSARLNDIQRLRESRQARAIALELRQALTHFLELGRVEQEDE
jgi:hypothetical protein